MPRSSWAALLAVACAGAWGDGFTAADVQYLYGPDLELPKGSDPIQLLTFEVANGWAYGDNFFFTDVTNGGVYDKKKPISDYGEFHSRLSLGKITGKDVSVGPISDFLLAGEADYPAGFSPTFCYGLGTNLAIPGAAFFSLNFFIRDEVATKGISFQVNPAWLFPFTTGPVKWSFGGWIDWMSGEGDAQKAWFQMQPTLFIDVGNFWGAPGKLETGIEYEYFKNFLGVKGWDVNHPQYVLKWNL
jgi:nucleoside-specific outer membrane channel protein Tsx